MYRSPRRPTLKQLPLAATALLHPMNCLPSALDALPNGEGVFIVEGSGVRGGRPYRVAFPFVNRLKTMRTTATTRAIWIRLPPNFIKKPRSHNTMRIATTVQSAFPIFDLPVPDPPLCFRRRLGSLLGVTFKPDKHKTQQAVVMFRPLVKGFREPLARKRESGRTVNRRPDSFLYQDAP
jgi:hypothetical protein